MNKNFWIGNQTNRFKKWLDEQTDNKEKKKEKREKEKRERCR